MKWMQQGLKKLASSVVVKLRNYGLIIGRLKTVEEELVEVGRNGSFLKPCTMF